LAFQKHSLDDSAEVESLPDQNYAGQQAQPDRKHQSGLSWVSLLEETAIKSHR
jgi:hypothetical protein